MVVVVFSVVKIQFLHYSTPRYLLYSPLSLENIDIFGTDPDPDPRMRTTNLRIRKVHLHNFLIDKRSYRSHKQIRIRIRIWEVHKHTDPDPQHW
jgi:hypothetical protein